MQMHIQIRTVYLFFIEILNTHGLTEATVAQNYQFTNVSFIVNQLQSHAMMQLMLRLLPFIWPSWLFSSYHNTESLFHANKISIYFMYAFKIALFLQPTASVTRLHYSFPSHRIKWGRNRCERDREC